MGSYAEEQLINALEKEIATFKAKKIICDCTECKYNKHSTCTSDNLMISKGYCMSSSGKQKTVSFRRNGEMKEIQKKVLEQKGIAHQEDILIEEMSELTKEILKHRRGSDNMKCIAEETADVLNVLDQIIYYYNIEIQVKTWQDSKLTRLEERLEKETYVPCFNSRAEETTDNCFKKIMENRTKKEYFERQNMQGKLSEQEFILLLQDTAIAQALLEGKTVEMPIYNFLSKKSSIKINRYNISMLTGKQIERLKAKVEGNLKVE